jgi:hypothetical protein
MGSLCMGKLLAGKVSMPILLPARQDRLPRRTGAPNINNLLMQARRTHLHQATAKEPLQLFKLILTRRPLNKAHTLGIRPRRTSQLLM